MYVGSGLGTALRSYRLTTSENNSLGWAHSTLLGGKGGRVTLASSVRFLWTLIPWCKWKLCGIRVNVAEISSNKDRREDGRERF